MNGADYNMVYKCAAKAALDSVLVFMLLLSFLSIELTLTIPHKTFRFNPNKITQRIIAALCCVSGLFFFTANMGVPEYISSLRQPPSTFYEEYYIDPKSVEITFPKHKRNLIVVFIESFDTGFLTIEDGGLLSESLIPDITSLMKSNVNFSATNGLGGANQLHGTSPTVAGIVAQYSGLPLSLNFNEYHYGDVFEKFLPGASGIGDILFDAGYKNYFILGSEIELSARDKYFKLHKNTVIYDYNYFRDNNYIQKNHKVWFGFEDRKLFSLAKEKITEITKEEPFFITLLTADTHAIDGYLDEKAQRVFSSKYKNVLFDMNNQLFDFLEWLKTQDFYENTTVVVLGDHLYMDWTFFPENIQNENRRFPVNIFMNSLLREDFTKHRLFSHFDMFTALIDSIGGIYDAKGLALGRSMNKNEPTLLEELGIDFVNKALRQKSMYYNKLWLMEADNE
jgi:phosphoglycerol transferase